METVQAKLPTEYGDFNITVYEGSKGQEIVVLSTLNLDTKKSVLMRVHSECITGDTFGSYKCDCGPQKSESLRLIADSGNGLFVYLRQEGRGIGLFEKIKTYQLQQEGYDTFQANIALGHKADARTYEVIKKICEDFSVKEVKLITNNPSKIHDIAQLGIKVTERIPLITEFNRHGKFYIETKARKFQHFMSEEGKNYFYGIHGIMSKNDVQEIGQFLENRINDPFLKICLSNDTMFEEDLSDLEIQKETKALFQEINRVSGCIPVLHFSFKKSKNPLYDIDLLKKNYGYFNFLQLNDMPTGQEERITRLASDSFIIDLPISNEFFPLFIKNEAFVNYVKEKKIFLLLDNSCGTGKVDQLDNYTEKINQLLDKGVNDIVLAGGFGPDTLENYFACRDYFRINLSIDAETRLKTDGKFDINKAKQYLELLLSHEHK